MPVARSVFEMRFHRVFSGLLLSGVLLGSAATPAAAQPYSPPTTQSSVPQQDLAEFEGHYEYRDNQTLFVVAHDGRLVALVNGTPYALRRVGGDAFTNPSGGAIPFQRDAVGRITSFSESSDTFRRLSSTVDAQTRRRLEARPSGPDGRPTVYRYEPPPAMADGIATARAGSATISADVLERLVNGVVDGTYPNVRSLLVYHGDALLLEEYFYGDERSRPHQMRSFTKSVISLLAGAAIDRGLLRADEPVVGRLGHADDGGSDPRKARITLTDLLSNRSGLACDDYNGDSPGHEVKLYETDDWVKAFLGLPMIANPGTDARYCSGGFFTAARLIERATGRPLADFAQDVLFEPLGIARHDWTWPLVLDRRGRNEFGQVYLRPRDMLKLGLLIARGGTWEGRRVVSASWIEAATSRQSRIGDSDYGLGIWHRWFGVRTPDGQHRVDTIMLSGNGGQKVYLVPSLDLIVVTTGVAFFDDAPANQMLARVLLPALLHDGTQNTGSMLRSAVPAP